MTSALLEVLGQRVRALRVAHNMTQQQLADAVGLSRTSITNVEAGRQGDIGVVNLIALAEALGTSIADLTGTAPLAVDASSWLELVRRVTESERVYRRLADEAWAVFDVTTAVRYRGRAEGLEMARNHHAEVIAAQTAGGGSGA
jgi:transcriptional regulator with XRE-family HTH domain